MDGTMPPPSKRGGTGCELLICPSRVAWRCTEYLMKEKLKKSDLETVPELRESLFPQDLPLADLEMADTPEEVEEAEDLFALFEHKDLDTDITLPEKYGLDEAETGEEEVVENDRSAAP